MAFKLVKRNKIAVAVKGTLPDDDGKPVKFDFKLHCKRLSQDEIDTVMKEKNGDVKSFIRNVAEGWDTVIDADGEPLPFSRDGLDELINTAGLPALIAREYMDQVSATAKN